MYDPPNEERIFKTFSLRNLTFRVILPIWREIRLCLFSVMLNDLSPHYFQKKKVTNLIVED